MTQEQFYYCLSRILELREKILGTFVLRRKAQATESSQAYEQQVDFDSVRRFATDKNNADKNTAESHALIKELAAQEAKIRNFVPASLYTTRIKATHPGQPSLYAIVETEQIKVEKALG